MSWRLHTQTNVSIEAGGTAATLSAATGAAVRLQARVERCPQARLRLSPGVEWGPSARTWTGYSALLLEANTTAGCTGLQVSIAPAGAAHPGAANPLAEWPSKGPLRKKTDDATPPLLENMTVCGPIGKCASDCKTYRPPLGRCYSPPLLFPADPQWGSSDVLDTCNSTHLRRSFYASADGSCKRKTGGFDLPLGVCVGPFGKPRPWGSFQCSK